MFQVADILKSKVVVEHYIMILEVTKKPHGMIYSYLPLGSDSILNGTIDSSYWDKVA